MSKYGVMVMGPAGAGKTTFCAALVTHLQLTGRSAFYVNLDPAAEEFEQAPDLDIKDLISVEDVMDEMGLGPNGALLYCFEFLLENLDWLSEALESLTEEYLVILDVPGQIELYTHAPVLPELTRFLTRPGNLDMRLCAAYLVEAMYMTDRAKFMAAALSAVSCMVTLGLPHVNVMSKMDHVKGQMPRRVVDEFLLPDASLLDTDPVELQRARDAQERDGAAAQGGGQPASPGASGLMDGSVFKRLNRAVANLVEDAGMVKFHKLSSADEDTVEDILSQIDHVIQYQEAQEPKEPKDQDAEVNNDD